MYFAHDSYGPEFRLGMMVLAFLCSVMSAVLSGKLEQLRTIGVPGGGITWSPFHPHVCCLGQEDWKAGHSWNVDTWSLHVFWASSQYGGLGGRLMEKEEVESLSIVWPQTPFSFTFATHD